MRYSSTVVPEIVWLPVQRNPGMSLCAGEPGLPFEKMSDTVPTSLIAPLVTPGFVDV